GQVSGNRVASLDKLQPTAVWCSSCSSLHPQVVRMTAKSCPFRVLCHAASGLSTATFRKQVEPYFGRERGPQRVESHVRALILRAGAEMVERASISIDRDQPELLEARIGKPGVHAVGFADEAALRDLSETRELA